MSFPRGFSLTARKKKFTQIPALAVTKQRKGPRAYLLSQCSIETKLVDDFPYTKQVAYSFININEKSSVQTINRTVKITILSEFYLQNIV